MRIAIVTTSWPARPGDPAGHFVQAEARALEREGHEVTVVAPEPGGAFGWPGVAARVRANPLRALDAARWMASARRALRHARVDRVVAHWAVPSAWPVAIPAASARPALEVVSHGGDVRLLIAARPLVRRIVARAVGARADRWRFVSSSLLEALLSALDAPTRRAVERIAEVRAPLLELPDVREAIAARKRALGGRRIAVSVGRLVPGKRVDRAIAEAAARRAAGAFDTLVIVGDGPERDRLERLARGLGVDACFVGAVDRSDALAWIGAADALLQASAAEGLSTVEREAEALGTPVLRVGPAASTNAPRTR